MLEEVENGDREVVVGIHQSGRARDDAVPIGVGVASKGDIEAILEADQALHCVGRGRIHANPTVPIDRHEPERRIDDIVHNREIQTIALGNRAPIVNFRRHQRIHAHTDIRAPNRIHIEHAAEIAHVSVEKVMPMGGGGALGAFERDSFYALKAAFQKLIGPGFDPSGDVVVRRAAVGRVVLEAAVVGRIVRRRDDNAVRHALPCGRGCK